MCYLDDEQLKCPELLPITYLFAPEKTGWLAPSGRWTDRLTVCRTTIALGVGATRLARGGLRAPWLQA